MHLDLPSEFDHWRYLSHPANQDLRGLNPDQVRQHYREFGEHEGRVCSAVDSRGAFLKLVPTGVPLLEIGPYFSPSFRPPEYQVAYLDYLGTEELRERARHTDGGEPDSVPEIDFVWTGQSYLTLLGNRKFDAVFSSHNIEHQPCLVTHLREVAAILAPGGRYFLAVPDRRYCFDHFLPETTLPDVLEPFVTGRTLRHSAENILEHRHLTAHNDSVRHWAGDHGDPPRIAAEDWELMARLESELHELAATEEYVDTHAWQFSPKSFREIVQMLARLGLSDLVVERLYPTLNGSNEFYTVLKGIFPENFDPTQYVSINPDVREAADPGRHWRQFGYWERRKWQIA